MTSISMLLHQRATTSPDRRIYTFLDGRGNSDEHITYGQLDKSAQQISASLQRLDASGERVVLLFPAGLDFIAAFYGCLYANAVVVPLPVPSQNHRLKSLQNILRDAAPKAVLTTAKIRQKLQPDLPDEFTKQPRWYTLQELEVLRAAACSPPLSTSDDTLAFLQYTSGSTANPKGVMVSHGNVLHNSAFIEQRFGHTPASRGLVWLPAHHDMGLIGGIIQPLYSDFPIVLLAPLDFVHKPIRWLQAISDYQVTTSGGPNFAYQLCIERIDLRNFPELDLRSWKVAFVGAEPIRTSTLDRFAKLTEPAGFCRDAFFPCYGLAENTLMVSGGVKCGSTQKKRKRNKALQKMVMGCGTSDVQQRVCIVDPKYHTLCDPNQVGEIWVSGPSVAKGYWRQTEKTCGTFNAYLADTGSGPFLRTGDLGFLADDELFITGRIKDLLIIRGRNYYPQDIESTVSSAHPALQEACGAAFTILQNEKDKLVIIQEVRRSYLPHLNFVEVLGEMRSAVAKQYQLELHNIRLLRPGALPKTTSGKVQRYLCRKKFLSNASENQNEMIIHQWK